MINCKIAGDVFVKEGVMRIHGNTEKERIPGDPAVEEHEEELDPVCHDCAGGGVLHRIRLYAHVRHPAGLQEL